MNFNDVIKLKEFKMKKQGKKPFSSLRKLDRQRKIGIKPSKRKDGKTMF